MYLYVSVRFSIDERTTAELFPDVETTAASSVESRDVSGEAGELQPRQNGEIQYYLFEAICRQLYLRSAGLAEQSIS